MEDRVPHSAVDAQEIRSEGNRRPFRFEAGERMEQIKDDGAQHDGGRRLVVYQPPTTNHQPGRFDYFAAGGAMVAGSQCSSALPSTNRQVSNHVVKYSAPGFRGSGYLRGISTVT